MIARSPDGDVTAEFRRKVGHLLSPMTRRSFQEQTIFWGPEALPTVMPVAVTAAPRSIGVVARPLLDLAAGQVRRAADGWRAVLRIGAVEHTVFGRKTHRPSALAIFLNCQLIAISRSVRMLRDGYGAR